MSITQQSESMYKYFKDCVCSSMMINEFIHNLALNAYYFNEKEKYVEIKSTRSIMRTSNKFEKEAAKIYTKK